MDVEKMKLKILEAVSGDLHKHIDRLYEELAEKKKIEYKLQDIIDHYLGETNKSLLLSRLTRQAVEAKRDIAFIFYCLSCPFYYHNGIDELIGREKRIETINSLNIPMHKYGTYIRSAKHYYKVYADYRIMIDAAVEYIQKK